MNWSDLEPAARVKKRLVWPWILAAVLLLVVGGGGTFLVAERNAISSLISGDRLDVFGQTDTGVPIDDGSFRFVIKSVGKAELQSNPPPAGVYFVVDATVTNTGREPRSFAARQQKWIDSSGHTYPAMGMSVVTSMQETQTVVVNPGQVIEVAMRFDVPGERQTAAIELHESATSAGAKARLY